MPASDIRVLEAQPYFSDEKARELFQFGNMVMDTATLCHVRVRVENWRGQVADGWGAIFLSHQWAYRAPNVSPGAKDHIMRRVVETVCQRVTDFKDFAHPIDIFRALEPELPAINTAICRASDLTEDMPYLGMVVCASPVDTALHDAFGIVNDVSTYNGYSRDFFTHDLSAYLGETFTNRYLNQFIQPAFAPVVPVFHTVGVLDRLTVTEVDRKGPIDEYPQSLDKWIERDGVFCFKIKLNGRDMAWDLNRLVSVYQVARQTHTDPDRRIYLSADTNEQSESPDYMVELLHRLREKSPDAYQALLLVEQPTERDLSAHRFDMRPLAALKPVIIDESLTSLADLDLALELGWTGVALKTCKCQSLELLLVAKAQTEGIYITVQDLTNPGIALLQSVGLTSRLPSLLHGLEANSRQYYPQISTPEAVVHPNILRVHDGLARTDTLRGPGLGYQIDCIDRPIFREA